MSFRGELREFELPDILQLIASQQKAGWLKVISRGDCHFVFFRDGQIISTKNPSDEGDPLEQYLQKRNLLTDDQMDRVQAIRRKSGMDVQDILKKEGLLSDDDIQEVFEAMVEEDIFELMTIKSGTYEFETEERSGPLPEGALSANIGPILMEGARKADEVSEMRRALGPEEGVLALSSAGRDAHPEGADERTVLGLVNGVRTIDTIIEDSGLDRYTATRALFDCAREGWVALMRKHRKAVDSEEVIGREISPVRVLRWAVPMLAMLLTAVLFSDVLNHFHADDALVGEWRKQNAQIESAQLREGMALAVEVYRVRHAELPANLDALVEDRLVKPEVLAAANWEYVPNGEHFTLSMATPAQP